MRAMRDQNANSCSAASRSFCFRWRMRFHNTRVSSWRGEDTVSARKSPPTVDANSPAFLVLRFDALAAERRAGVVREFPAAVGLHAGRGRRGHRLQAVILGQLEDAHAAELAAPGLLRNIDQQVAVAHPRTRAPGEGDGGKLGQQLLLFGHGLQRRREELAAEHRQEHQQQARHGHGARDAPHRDPRGAHHGELAAARQRTQARATRRS